ncbi:MAG: hypothetical protein DDT40_00602 [candidate division WS2 bacterium]|uniref:Flavodoxin-like domain-containing protein n=1 Tax=Psychracetigena formicireducens TaxID=2986056 RepID=A0A9E2BFK9_PSYF1|nr:hypothetical protein [Candidatus Psychracetigena formicireducens]MBT9144706.1 hypothetical protein [Candidatus Psychracetigena formicireducens]MBT9150430.1 hypothetical protein [Candidatus Psychracetigena formicireducens]
MNNILVVYYSLEGNTKFIAEILKEVLWADLLELKPENEINSRGIMKYLWGGRQVYMRVKPALLPFTLNPFDYETLFIGTPVWAWTFAPPLWTFFSQVKLKGKNIGLFCTSDGSRGKTLENMISSLEGNHFLGKEEFVSVLTNKEKNKLKAIAWVEKLLLSKINT